MTIDILYTYNELQYFFKESGVPKSTFFCFGTYEKCRMKITTVTSVGMARVAIDEQGILWRIFLSGQSTNIV